MSDLIITPRTINQIYKSNCSKQFRIRDVKTLKDYLVLDFIQTYDVVNQVYADVMCCDNQKYQTLDCSDRKYFLLSSREEMSFYKRYKRSALVNFVIQSYKETKYGNT